LIVENIPDELKCLSQWVNWYWFFDEELGKWTKPLLNPKIFKPGKPYKASHSKPSDWGTYEKALENFQKFPDQIAGIGFVFSPSDPYAGVDLDDCRDAATGEISPFAMSIIEKLKSYTEVSPSQRGVKIIVKGSLPEYVSEGGGKDERLKIEVYDRKRYFTITGQVLNV
jgi:primase-polymerase (primpol)-like protein